ncbi:MAG: CDP-alcohol phosphatidyltransferase family protein [Sulfuricella sp.]|nr:CDP-alcohol phosphatidyltransferase family protein [Sulfuricella sp.]
MRRAEWCNLANAVTSVRAVLAPVLVYLLGRGLYEFALWAFLAAGLSDALDGFLARRLHQLTRFGAILDPVADKLVIVSSAIALAAQDLLPLWLVLLIVARDVVIVAGAVSFRLRFGHLDMAPLPAGKASTFAQIGLILLVLLQAASWLDASAWLPALHVLTGAVAVASGAQYVAVWGSKALRQSG